MAETFNVYKQMKLLNLEGPTEHEKTLLVVSDIHYVAVNPDTFAHGGVNHVKTVAESIDYQSHMAHIA